MIAPRPKKPPQIPNRQPLYEPAKRLIDIGVASVALGLLSPLWLLISLLIRATSPGPSLYRGTVIGKDGRPFTYYKFRTMIAGDDGHHKEWLRDFVLSDKPYRDGQFKVVGDPRVTPIGRVLRKTSLDEIPQLINVLRGEMSLVGPRPPVPFEYSLYDDSAKARLVVSPGITGLYQVSARSRAPFSQMLAIDLDYIQRRSLALDLAIMARTVGVILRGVGAA